MTDTSADATFSSLREIEATILLCFCPVVATSHLFPTVVPLALILITLELSCKGFNLILGIISIPAFSASDQIQPHIFSTYVII
jgi:hypothetical protein